MTKDAMGNEIESGTQDVQTSPATGDASATAPTVGSAESLSEGPGPSDKPFINLFEKAKNAFIPQQGGSGSGTGFFNDFMKPKKQLFMDSFEKMRGIASQPDFFEKTRDAVTGGAIDEFQKTWDVPKPFQVDTSASTQADPTGGVATALGGKLGKYTKPDALPGYFVGEVGTTAMRSGMNAATPGDPSGQGGFLRGFADGALRAGARDVGYETGAKVSTISDVANGDSYDLGNFTGRHMVGLPLAVVNSAPGIGLLKDQLKDIVNTPYTGPADPMHPPDTIWAGLSGGAARTFNTLAGGQGYTAPDTSGMSLKYTLGDAAGTGLASLTAPVVYPMRKLLIEPMQAFGATYNGGQ